MRSRRGHDDDDAGSVTRATRNIREEQVVGAKRQNPGVNCHVLVRVNANKHATFRHIMDDDDDNDNFDKYS